MPLTSAGLQQHSCPSHPPTSRLPNHVGRLRRSQAYLKGPLGRRDFRPGTYRAYRRIRSVASPSKKSPSTRPSTLTDRASPSLQPSPLTPTTPGNLLHLPTTTSNCRRDLGDLVDEDLLLVPRRQRSRRLRRRLPRSHRRKASKRLRILLFLSPCAFCLSLSLSWVCLTSFSAFLQSRHQPADQTRQLRRRLRSSRIRQILLGPSAAGRDEEDEGFRLPWRIHVVLSVLSRLPSVSVRT